MHIEEYVYYFSAPRLNRYLEATNQDPLRAIALYKANLRIAQAFHPLLGVLEVAVRNRLNDVLCDHFDDNDWILNQRSGFMSDPSLTFTYKKTGKRKTNDFLRKQVDNAEKRLQRARTSVTSGKVIAEQTLGFWTNLFEVHYYRILKGKPIQIFKILPPGGGRKQINDELEKIRLFRNRINHNEPICFSGNTTDFASALGAYQAIINISTWIDPHLTTMMEELDEVHEAIDLAEKI